MKYCRNKKGYGFILTQIGIVVPEIQLNKLEDAKRLKRCIDGTTFAEVLKAPEIIVLVLNFFLKVG